jgi:hypothetical protein
LQVSAGRRGADLRQADEHEVRVGDPGLDHQLQGVVGQG